MFVNTIYKSLMKYQKGSEYDLKRESMALHDPQKTSQFFSPMLQVARFGIVRTMYCIVLFMLHYCITVLFTALSENKAMIFISLLILVT